MSVRAHGLTCLFWATLAALFVVTGARFELTESADHVVSGATIAGVDVGARTLAYLRALGIFGLVGAGVLALLPRIARAAGEGTAERLESASLVGLSILAFAAVTSTEGLAIALVAWLEVAFVVASVLDGRLLRGRLHPQAGSAFLLLSALSFAVLSATPWRSSAAAIAGLALVLHVLVQLARRGRGDTFADHLLHASVALAFVPLALVVREEIALIAEARGLNSIGRGTAAVLVAVAIGTWALVRLWRMPAATIDGRVDVARALERSVFPALILGLGAIAGWVPWRDPPDEMFEAANAGLAIQQLFGHGRLPFFDTFDVHGLSDSAMGLLYTGVHGWSGTTWQDWDFVPIVVAWVFIYALLARVLRSAPFAFAFVCTTPFLNALFPPAIAFAIVFVFVALAFVRARRTARFAALAFLLALAFVWRLDIGYAVSLGCAAVLGAAAFVDRDGFFPWRRLAAGVALAAGAVVALTWAFAAARGVDLVGRFEELRHIVGSNQAFGGARIAQRIDAAVVFRTFAVPILSIAVTAAALARLRSGDTARRQAAAPALVPVLCLVFLLAVDLCMFPRGLVRHTFLEKDGSYVTAFGFALLALAPAVLMTGRRLGFGAFVVLGSLLALAFDVGDERHGSLRGNLLARAAIRLESVPLHAPALVDRSRTSARFQADNIEPMRALAAGCLRKDETFADLSGAPMLYVYAGVRSPHWLNHLLIAQGDWLERRLLSEIDVVGVPLVVMHEEDDLRSPTGMLGNGAVDGVPLALRQGIVFDRMHAVCEPFTLAGRWQVWSRADWASPAAPAADRDELLEHLREPRLLREPWRARAVEARAGETVVLRVAGQASRSGTLRIECDRAIGARRERIVRDILWRAGDTVRCVEIGGEGLAFGLEDLALSTLPTGAQEGLRLESVEVHRVEAPDRAEAARRAVAPLDMELGATARLFGQDVRGDRRPIATLHDAETLPVGLAAGQAMRFPFSSLPRRERSVLVVARITAAGRAPLGATVRFGARDAPGGAFRFDVAPSIEARTYVFRPGVQASWHLRPNDWLEIEAQGGPFHVVSLELVRAD